MTQLLTLRRGSLRSVLAAASLLLALAGVGPAQPSITYFGDYFTLHHPAAITNGPDGALWFGQSDSIGRLTPSGGFSFFPPALGYNGRICAGSDGALWFTQPASIGRITASGAVTSFPLPPGDSTPRAITAGTDGALWFTEDHKIGRITTGGVLTEFPLAGPAVASSGITAGPDGAMWFTESSGIGRINLSGNISEFHTAQNSSDIALGPDGALWFTEPVAFKIGRITTSGSMTEYQVPSGRNIPVQFGTLIPTCVPSSIIPGPDGALWFTELSGGCSQIARITTAGVVTEYYTFNAPNRIAVGPDRALWFTTEGAIGRVDLGLSPLSIPVLSPRATTLLTLLLIAISLLLVRSAQENG